MTCMDKIRAACLGILLLLVLSPHSTLAADQGLFQTDVFVSGQGGYHTYRIPALLATSNGTLLAFIEARKNSSADNGDIDMVLKRSTDIGAAWGEPIMIWNEPGDVTVGNPVPVQDRETGAILLLLTRDNLEIFVTKSNDHGLTWSEPRNITPDVKAPDWRWVATGPGHGIQLESGRIIIPCDHTVDAGLGQGGVMHSHIMYSDDHGATWRLGASLPEHTDECTAVQLADGALYLNMRNNYFKSKRAFAVSADSGESFGRLRWDSDLIEPVCQGSVLRYTRAGLSDKNRLLFSNPAARTRDHMTVKLSMDEARSWPVSRVIYEGLAGYSDLTVLPDMSIGLLYENGTKRYHDKITFARFSLEWLTQSADRLPDGK
jgi:sialidase-1